MDVEAILRSLNEHEVRYVVIGAMSFPVHGFSRTTLDLDVLIEATPANASRTKAALADVGYDVTDLTIEDLLTTKVLIRRYIVQTDIHPSALGATFDEVWRNRIQAQIGDTLANFAGLDDLIAMKQAAGRPKDLEDLRVLLKLKEANAKATGGGSA
jgi:predicted nucleotidyltransferase